MTHAEQILHAVADLVLAGQSTFARKDVRDRIGVSQDEWMSGYTAIFQAMRADHPGGAPSIVERFRGVFRQVGHGEYMLTDKGQRIVRELRSELRGAGLAEANPPAESRPLRPATADPSGQPIAKEQPGEQAQSAEPDLSAGEASLRKAVLTEIQAILETTGRPCLLLTDFGLDICVWMESGGQVTTRFIELKAFTGGRQGGVGFGNGSGKGSQVDMLIMGESDLALLESSTRWIVADATLPAGSERFAIVSATVAKRAAMNGVARGKQNNLRMTAFRPHVLKWHSFLECLRDFLLQ